MVDGFAPAKINLYLHVVGRRADGYHLLDSLIAFAGVGDVLAAQPADGVTLVIDGPFAAGLPTGDDNLVLRAARALQRLAGVERGAAIRLTKRLPPASGIGGGSADAAATLRILLDLWNVSPSPEELMAVALGLGADVPMCLMGRAAFASGIGERLEPAPPLPSCWLVLVNPGLPVATPAVFGARVGPFGTPAPFAETPRDARRFAALLKERGNDLAAPAIAIAPAIGDVLRALEASKGCLLARMSGSGATCFGLYEAAPEAERAVRDIAVAHPAWWVQAGPLLELTPGVRPAG
ncbi:MAG: 4-(cytidine 5'-diphospho)-2-C-methyl-D-erythritol kinase [Magnetospirillum sp. WYHS-4]